MRDPAFDEAQMRGKLGVWLSRANYVLNVSNGANDMAGPKAKDNGMRETQTVAPRMDHYNAEFRGYINVNLSDEQRDHLPLWLENADIEKFCKGWCATGLVLSMKLDPKTGNFMASATQRNEQSHNAGLAVTARANSPVKALQRLLYILDILGAGKWEDVQPMADPDRW